MCLAVFALNAHPDWPLILIANRDEFHARPTRPLSVWPDLPILGGRDLRAGGSWMGLGDNNRFAMVTNHRNLRRPVPQQAQSRGQLVNDFLNSSTPADKFCAELDASRFAGFNLLLRDEQGWFHYSNVTDRCSPLHQGVFGLSNALLNTPWPKTLLARARLQQALAQNRLEPDRLLRLLHELSRPADARLPDTGLPLERERLLSSCFIVSEDYGTRGSTLMLQHRRGRLLMLEESYDAKAQPTGRRQFVLDRAPLVPRLQEG
ncbi:NRDE family protein [Marinobacterium sediminicola]